MARCQALGWAAPRDVGNVSLLQVGDMVEKPSCQLQAAFAGFTGSSLGSNGTGSSVLWSSWVPLNPV